MTIRATALRVAPVTIAVALAMSASRAFDDLFQRALAFAAGSYCR